MARKKPHEKPEAEKPEDNENQAPLSNAELAWLRRNVLA
jgi:hypothetical protein